ncbi:MAG: TonB-dependent receptor [Alistipes sp.]|nr:TonB-dependent receptor [Alistipes sp.]
MKRFFALLLLSAAIFAPSLLPAQITTSSMSGTVTDNERNPLAGAAIIATHTPSGSRYGVAADSNGRFTIQGMRTGGPYTVEISYIGFRTLEIRNVMLDLGTPLELRPVLEADNALEAVTVSVSSDRIFDNAKTGAATNFSAEDIARIPTVSRNIDDITALSPLASPAKTGGISFGGQNNRYNSFNIDGLPANDMYGLTSTGTNAGLTSANPVPLDALEQIAVSVAPFDVRRGGFTGGSIDAVTKSGTNDFAGSAYFYYNDRNFYGTTPGRGVANREKLSEQYTQIAGATLGGAVLRDKLFFFVNGEFALERYPSSYHPGAGGAITAAEADRIAARYKQLTGYDGGGYGPRNIDRTAGSLIARLDWNIDSRNTLSARYNFIDGRKDEYSNSPTAFMFGGTGYTSVSSSHTVGAELNTRIGDAMHNELRAGYSFVTDGRDTERLLPFVSIAGLGGRNATASIGTDRYAGANSLDQHTLTVTDNFTLYAGRHTLTFGIHNEYYRSHVVYVANSLGSYTYASLEDFENDMASKYEYNYTDTSVTGSATWGPTLNALQTGIYAQDKWDPSERFSLTYGLRVDVPVIFDSPTVNEKFNGSSIAAEHGAVTGRVPHTQVLWSPRVGFRWYADSQHRTLVRGGAGLFTGRVPFVWIVNNFSNTGVEQKGVVLTGGNGVTAQPFSPTPQLPDYSTINPSVQVLDGKFRYPQLFRADLAVEHTFGNGWRVGLEALYGKTVNNVTFRNLSLSDSGERFTPAGENAPSAVRYKVHPDYAAVYYTTNTSRGYSYSVTASVERSFAFGLEVGAYYTFGHVYSVSDATSSAQASNWTRTYAVDADKPALSRSVFDSPHRLLARISYSKRYARIFGTTVSLVYRMSSGQSYSLCFADTGTDINGDGTYGNTLMYIPTEEDMQSMKFADADSRRAWNDFIEGDRYLRSHRGGFAERNSMRTPLEHRLDMHLAQDFYFGAHTSRKLQITLDVVNMGNLIARDWGAVYTVSNSRLTPVTVTLDDDGKTPVYRFAAAEAAKNDILSRWHMQLGVRVVF